jgi:hypothetical protein
MEKTEKRKIVSDIIKNVKLHNAGYKPPKRKKNEDMCCAPDMSNGVIYPSLYINSKNAPELKGYDAESEVLLLVKGKITSHSLNENMGESRETWDIQIKEIACLNKKEKEDKEEDY